MERKITNPEALGGLIRMYVRALRESCTSLIQKEASIDDFMLTVAEAFNNIQKLLKEHEDEIDFAYPPSTHTSSQRAHVQLIKIYSESFLGGDLELLHVVANINNIIHEMLEEENEDDEKQDMTIPSDEA